MNDRDIDTILSAPHKVDAAVLDRVTASMSASLRPVRPIGSLRMLASMLLLISTAIAFLGAWSFQMYGLQKLSGAEMGAIFPALAIFTWLAAWASVAAMTPGGFRWNTRPLMLLPMIVICFLALAAIFFNDYSMDLFVPQGIPCLRAGLIVAIPAGLASWLVLRRGFAVNAPAAGLAAGTLAGLAGLTMLEIHCPNLHAMHVMLWHTAVIPISGIAGALLTYFFPKNQ